MRVRFMAKVYCLIAMMFFGSAVFGQGLFTIGKGKAQKTFTFEDIKKKEKSRAYEIEKTRFQLVDGFAKQAYLDYFWKNEAKKSGKSVDAARKAYIAKKTKVSSAEIDAKFKQFKDMPQLKQFDDKEKRKQVEQWLKQLAERDVVTKIFAYR